MSTAASSDDFKNAASVRIELDRAASELEQLKTLYEQYFMGIHQFPPDSLHQKMQRKIRTLRNAPFKNSQTNYQLRMLEQRYQTYATYWRRVLREREEGTYFRDVFKAELREKVAKEEAESQTQRGKAKANVKALFESYQHAVEQQTGKRLKLDYEKFQKRLVQQAKSFKEKNGNKKLSFKVVVDEGKVRVRATAKEYTGRK
jgi:hypothetical protein